jgi:CubicO group peptidase (beta-lactamase class C family)
MALGIYGQCIYINPARHIVIVQTSAWPEPVSPLQEEEQGAAFEKIEREIVP